MAKGKLRHLILDKDKNGNLNYVEVIQVFKLFSESQVVNEPRCV